VSNKPLFVIISDVHFNIANLELSTISVKTALDKAEELQVPLIISGDLNDSKAIIRGEVINALINLFRFHRVPVYCLIGNHDLINERGTEHTLNFLKPYINIIDQFSFIELNNKPIYFIPYQSNKEDFYDKLKLIPQNSLIIMHQGITGALAGDYIVDKSAVNPNYLKSYIVYSGHYHSSQTIQNITFIGNPYTMSFGEADDLPKGFAIINQDYSIERINLNLRRHLIINYKLGDESKINIENNIIKVKFSGLELVTKKKIAEDLFQGNLNFILEIDSKELNNFPENHTENSLSDTELFDKIIELNNDFVKTEELKRYWRELVNENT